MNSMNYLVKQFSQMPQIFAEVNIKSAGISDISEK